MIRQNKGQSLIEVVLAIGIIVLVITGVIILIVTTLSVKTATLQRQRAGDMAKVVVEELLEDKKNNDSDFWNLTPIVNQTVSGFSGFVYSVGFSKVTDDDCSDDLDNPDCVNATITINWGDKSLTVNRFFSK